MLKKILIILFTLSSIVPLSSTDHRKYVFHDDYWTELGWKFPSKADLQTEMDLSRERQKKVIEKEMAHASLLIDMRAYNGSLLGTGATAAIFLINNATHSRKFPRFSFAAMCAAASYTFYLGYLKQPQMNTVSSKSK